MEREIVPERDLLLAGFVRSRRRGARLTQRELADLAGVGKRFVIELESGKQTLRLDKVNHVLGAFGKRLGPVDAPRTEAPARETEGLI
jgi:y4mF family transcriptional regulator